MSTLDPQHQQWAPSGAAYNRRAISSGVSQRSGRTPPLAWRQLLLHQFCHHQRGIEALVVRDCRLVHLPDLVEHQIGKGGALLPDFQRPVRELANLPRLPASGRLTGVGSRMNIALVEIRGLGRRRPSGVPNYTSVQVGWTARTPTCCPPGGKVLTRIWMGRP